MWLLISRSRVQAPTGRGAYFKNKKFKKKSSMEFNWNVKGKAYPEELFCRPVSIWPLGPAVRVNYLSPQRKAITKAWATTELTLNAWNNGLVLSQLASEQHIHSHKPSSDPRKASLVYTGSKMEARPSSTDFHEQDNHIIAHDLLWHLLRTKIICKTASVTR